MLGSEDADGAKASEAQDIGSAPAAEAPADTVAIEAHSEALSIAEPSKEEQAAGTAADATQQPQASTAADAAGDGEDSNIPTAAGQGRGKRGRGGAKPSGRKQSSRARPRGKRQMEEQDTDPEEEGGKEEAHLPTRRSSRAVTKPKTFADEFIGPDAEALTHAGSSAKGAEGEETAEPKQDEQPAVKPGASQDSDEAPLRLAIKLPAQAEAQEGKEAAEGQAQEPKSPDVRTMRLQSAEGDTNALEQAAGAKGAAEPAQVKSPRNRKAKQDAAQEDAPAEAEKAEGGAGAEEQPRSPGSSKRKARLDTGQEDALAQEAEGEAGAKEQPKSPPTKRRRQQEAAQEAVPEQAAGKAAASTRRRGKSASAFGSQGKGAAGAGRKSSTVSRDATPEQATQEAPAAQAAAAAPTEPEQAPPEQPPKEAPPMTAQGAGSTPGAPTHKAPLQDSMGPPAQKQQPAQKREGAQQQATLQKPLSELERITEGLVKAQEAHDKILHDLRKLPQLEFRVKGYLQQLSRMNLTVDQLSKTGIGKRLRSITKWGNQRKSALEPMSAAQEADPETGDLPEHRPSWELAMTVLEDLQNSLGMNRTKQTARKSTGAPAPPKRLVQEHKRISTPGSSGGREKHEQMLLMKVQREQEAARERGSAEARQPAAVPAVGKRGEPRVTAIGSTAIGSRKELPASLGDHLRKPDHKSSSTGSAVRDRALGILLDALAPDQALSREEAAQKLEAALYASCTNGRAAGPSGQPAEPGVTYMRRLRVLWSWLDSSSPHRSPGLKRLFIEGKLAAPDLATMDARKVRELTEQPAASATPHIDLQNETDGTPAGTARGSAEAPYLNGGMQQSIDMNIDVPNQGIGVSALPSQEVLAKLQAFCEGSLQPPQPPGPLQGLEEPPLEQTVGEIIRHQEGALRACLARAASPQQLHGIIAAGRLLERSLGVASAQSVPQHAAASVLPPEEAQLQLQAFAQAALAALARASAAPGQQASAIGGSPLRTPLPPETAAAMQLDPLIDSAAPPPPPEPASIQPVFSGPGQSQEVLAANGGSGAHEGDGAPDLAASLPREGSPQTPVMASAAPDQQGAPEQASMEQDEFARMRPNPAVRAGCMTERKKGPIEPFKPGRDFSPEAGLLHSAWHEQKDGAKPEEADGIGVKVEAEAMQIDGAEAADVGGVNVPVDAEKD